jgi:hypothetical protein
MAVPRVLLLTGTPPGSSGGGKIFLRDLCLSYPRGSISCFVVTQSNSRPVEPDLDWLPTASIPFPRQHGFAWPGPGFARLSRFLVRRYVHLIQVPALAARVAQSGRQRDVEMVWAVLNHPILISVTRRLVSTLSAPLVTTVWDPPERLLTHWEYDRFSRRIVLREFEKVLRMSVRCSVASEGMGDEYKKRYGIEPVVLIHGVHPSMRKPPAKELTGEKQFVIGFAGSLYARREWQALLSALSKADWQIEGHDVTVRFLGRNASFHAEGKVRIEYLGWRSFEETVELMSQVDVAYLPYWLDESYSLSVRVCFPNKLTAYLAAGRPVLFHGPEDSSPARFFRRFPVGLCCHSLEESEIIESLRRFITDREFYAAATQAGQVALDQELDLRVFRQRFATLIGVDEGALLPLPQCGFDSAQ